MLDPGQQAPAFELPNHAGEPVSLDDFDGRVVVYFYPRADTPGCTTEACGFRDTWDEFAERGVPIIGISDDSVSDLEKFRDKYDLPIELLSDESGEVASAYGSYGEKNMFGKTFDGVFRNTFVVRNGTIEHVFTDVSPDGHAQEILSRLE
ncbi:thioredoxin-dependent thiol peroxidase [Haladaptatus caseinilyticus]|uniref:thioredoxin-dependent thiol peroxidase n=1 Tax=Haladaptatus caseinilyticus TaxID=2993314 RepID=UPI00224A7087|nr:thioredoxin-dependent thiol peroxidase [Haladaptatus caseinilyticus]